ncbi:MAG TPA: prephenate dehydrogenase/arogenate dehydrogenase family protein [Casimicrobiaceae bacterium]|jgi:prephenate dehydrogenase
MPQIGKLVVVGVGLIGGSCALALRAAGAVSRIVGVGRGRGNLDDALRRGIIDVAHTLDEDWASELQIADIVLVAAPLSQYPALFATIAPAAGPQTIVTDAGSTKQDVIATARAAFRRSISRFVPGHPIAGSEQSGALAADGALFVGRDVILTPTSETAPDACARVTALWQACGAHVTTMSAAAHDRALAAVSHLPHMLAFALVAELASRQDAAELFARSGTGFRDFTRIAASSPEMWRDVSLANREALLDELARFRAALDDATRLLKQDDAGGLEALFERASMARRQLDKASGSDAS